MQHHVGFLRVADYVPPLTSGRPATTGSKLHLRSRFRDGASTPRVRVVYRLFL